MKKSTIAEINKHGLPWIVFQLAGSFYAISTRYVSAIGQLDQKCAQLPEKRPYIRGLITFRDRPIQLLDMRALMGFEALTTEADNFNQLINKGKNDHLIWVKTLEESVTKKIPFTLATDPHECAFGKWFDSYHTDNPAIRVLLKEIAEPHAKLHQTAVDIEKCKDSDPNCVANLLEQARSNHIDKIIKLLDRLIGMHDENYNELMLALEDGERAIALVVDRVIGVQEIEPYEDNNVRATMEKSFAVGIAKTNALDHLILLLDDNALLDDMV